MNDFPNQDEIIQRSHAWEEYVRSKRYQNWLSFSFLFAPGFSVVGGGLLGVVAFILYDHATYSGTFSDNFALFITSLAFENDESGPVAPHQCIAVGMAFGVAGAIPSAIGLWFIGAPIAWALARFHQFHSLSVAICGIIISTLMLISIGGFSRPIDQTVLIIILNIYVLTWFVIFGFCLLAFWIPRWLFERNLKSGISTAE